MKPLNAWPYRFDKKPFDKKSFDKTPLNKTLSLSLVFLLLSACSTLPESFSVNKPSWQINGKMAYQQAGKVSGSASFQWIDSEKRTVIHAFGPLGQNLFSLLITPNKALYQQADGTQLSAPNAETLLQQAGDFHFPVNHLRFWLQGKTQGDESNIHYNNAQQLSSLEARDWQVSFNYKAEKPVPHKIKLHNSSTHLTIINKQYEQF